MFRMMDATAAVLFEPAGLTVAVPAELVIVATEAFSPASVAFSQSDDEFVLDPVRLAGDPARLQTAHFSSSGTAAPTPDEVAALGPGGDDPEARARQGVVQELNRAGATGEDPDMGVVVQHLMPGSTTV